MASETVSSRVDSLESRVDALENQDVVTAEEFNEIVTVFRAFVAEVRDKAQGM